MSADPPQTIGRYRLVDELGRGGMGVVYRAEDPELGRPVAVKVILFPPGVADRMRSELEARFRREARAAAGIHHPGVVTVHDAGRDGEYLFLVMELVDGESLSQRLRQPEPLPRARAFDIAARVADALAAAHARGVVHRDVTPRNILLARDGRVVVTDFGIARSFGDDTAELTRSGSVLGSPSYVAPEQARGRNVEHRADLFSLGVVLFEMLLGRRPFVASDVTSVLYQIVHEDPLAATEVRDALGPGAAALLARCLAKSPDGRLPNAAELAREARRLGAGDGDGDGALGDPQADIVTEELPPTELFGRQEAATGRRFPFAALFAVLVLVLGAVAGVAWLRSSLISGPTREEGGVVPQARAVPEPSPPDAVPAARGDRTQAEAADPPPATKPPEASPAIAAPPPEPPREETPRAKAPERAPAENAAAPVAAPPAEPGEAVGAAATPDSVAPVLAIDDPPASLTESAIVLGGRVLDDRGGVDLTVDGAAVEVGEGGRFTVRRDLEPGRNVLTFVAADEAGNRTVKSFEVVPPSAAAAGGAAPGNAALPPAPRARQPGGRTRFADRGDGTVVDTRTGLMWAKRGDGQSHGFKDAKQTCKRLKLGDHRDWRLPRIEELEELAAASRSPGSGLGPVQLPAPVWSSTKEGATAWAFDFVADQRTTGSTDTGEFRVLCVRRLPQPRDRPTAEPGLPGGPERGPPAQRGPGGGA